MALNNDTNFPPSGLAPYRIDRTWCLGDSLPYLNANFTNFDTRIDANTTALAAASATLNTTIASTSSTVITTLSTVPYARLNDGNQSGIAPIYGCRAWVNFDGTGAISTNQTIRAQGNVSSVYKNGTGDYTITFTTALPDANYAYVASIISISPTNATLIAAKYAGSSTTISFRIQSTANPSSAIYYDVSEVCTTIFR